MPVLFTNPADPKKKRPSPVVAAVASPAADGAPLPDIDVPQTPEMAAGQRAQAAAAGRLSIIQPPTAPYVGQPGGRGPARLIVPPNPQPTTQLPDSMTTDEARFARSIGSVQPNPDPTALAQQPVSLVMPQRVSDAPAADAGIRAVPPSVAPGAAGAPIAGGGRMIKGVATFSDGSGNIPQTITPQQVAAAGNRLNVVSPTAFANPYTNANAPGFADLVNPAGAVQPATSGPQGLANPVFAQRAAASDMASVATGDFRSPLGQAANSLRVQMVSGTPRQRRAAERGLASLQQQVGQLGEASVADAGAMQRGAATEAGVNARTGATIAAENQRNAADNAAALQRAQLVQPAGSVVTLANGQLAVVNPRTAKSQAVTGPDGQPVTAGRTTATPQQKRTQALVDAFNANVAKLLQSAQIPGQPALTQQQVSAIKLQAARGMAGVQVYTNPKTGQKFMSVNGEPPIPL